MLLGTARVVAAVVSLSLLVGFGYGWSAYRTFRNHAQTIDVAGLGSDPTGAAGADGLQHSDGSAQNILVVGIDSRAGLSDAEKRALHVGADTSSTSTDTLMLIHVPADGSRAISKTIGRLGLSKYVSARFYRDYDAALTPVLARPTPELGWLDPRQPYEVVIDRLIHLATFTPLQNATGDPAISLPMGADAQGLPIGVQVTTSQGHEARLLEVAYELEAARPFRRIQDTSA